MDSGWVKIHRQLQKWEWYTDSKMVHLLLHMVLKANHAEKKWRGIIIERGQFISGRKALSRETGITQRSIRTCIDKLKTTSELTTKTTSRFTLFTLVNWDKYQLIDYEPTNKTASSASLYRPATDQRPTTNNNDKNYNKDKETHYEESSEPFSPAETKKARQAESECSYFENSFSETPQQIFELWKSKHLPQAVCDGNTEDGLRILTAMIDRKDFTLEALGQAFHDFNKQWKNDTKFANYGLRGVANNIGVYLPKAKLEKAVAPKPVEVQRDEFSIEELKERLKTAPNYLKGNWERLIADKEAESHTEP